MKVVVCVKQTPSTTATLAVKGGAVSWEDPGGKPNVVNPWDEYAIEEAIRFKENRGAAEAIAVRGGDPSREVELKALLTRSSGLACTEDFFGERVTPAGVDRLERDPIMH